MSSPEVERRIVVEQRQPVVAEERIRVLVTNDDGIDAPGISHLAHALAGEFDVTVAAPAKDSSGMGTGIGRFDPAAGIPLRRVDIGLPRAYAIDGPPGLAVMAAALGAFGEPFHLVVSGINAGINTGQSVIHSGTVGAALTARTFGSHGLAVSIEPSDPWQWQTAAEIALAVARWITSTTRDPAVFSVNVPGVAIEEVQGLRCAELDKFGYFRVAIADEGGQKLEFELASEHDRESSPGCDTWLIRNRLATITELGNLTGARECLPDDADAIWRPHSGEWQTASTLLPSGSRTKAP
jgi:5'-nucleotidase